MEDAVKANKLKFDVADAITKAAGGKGQFFGQSYDCFGILFQKNEGGGRSLYPEILERLSEYTAGMPVTIGAGGIVDSINKVPLSKKQAQYAIGKDTADGGEDTIKYDESSSSNIVSQVKRYIREKYNENLNIKEIAGLFYINPAYLGQLFKNASGVYFNEYLNKTRIGEAKRLMASGNYKMTDIIEKVGYKYPEYFYRQFKKYEKINTAEYKKTIDSGREVEWNE
jgi:AraC-like DNA-binding protein